MLSVIIFFKKLYDAPVCFPDCSTLLGVWVKQTDLEELQRKKKQRGKKCKNTQSGKKVTYSVFTIKCASQLLASLNNLDCRIVAEELTLIPALPSLNAKGPLLPRIWGASSKNCSICRASTGAGSLPMGALPVGLHLGSIFSNEQELSW